MSHKHRSTESHHAVDAAHRVEDAARRRSVGDEQAGKPSEKARKQPDPTHRHGYPARDDLTLLAGG